MPERAKNSASCLCVLCSQGCSVPPAWSPEMSPGCQEEASTPPVPLLLPERKSGFLPSLQLLHPSPGKGGSRVSLGDRRLPALTRSTGHKDLGRAQTGGYSSCLPLEGRGKGVRVLGMLTFIPIFVLIFGSCHLLANDYYEQVTAFYKYFHFILKP